MSNRTCSILFGFLIVSLTVLLGGCKGNDSSGGSSTLVAVTDQSGNHLPDVTVVLGESNGVMITHGKTDVNGQITFNDSPANATVTSAMSCLRSGATTTTYSLVVKYDVNEPVTLQLCSSSGSPNLPSSAPTLGTVTVNVTNAINGITQNEILTNGPLYTGYGSSLITQQTITIRPLDLQTDGTLSIIVIGKDANGTAIGYGALLDQTFTNGMSANITVDQPMGSVQYQITNIPTTTNVLYSDLMQVRTGKGIISTVDYRTLSSAPTATTINMPYMPGLGDQYNYSVYVSSSQNNNNGSVVSSSQSINIIGPSAISPSNQSFDLSQALIAPSSLTVSGANTATPTLSWSELDPGATNSGLLAIFRLSSADFLYLSINKLSNARTSVTFPELPDSLAAFRPAGVSSFSVASSADAGGVSMSSFSNLALVGR